MGDTAADPASSSSPDFGARLFPVPAEDLVGIGFSPRAASRSRTDPLLRADRRSRCRSDVSGPLLPFVSWMGRSCQHVKRAPGPNRSMAATMRLREAAGEASRDKRAAAIGQPMRSGTTIVITKSFRQPIILTNVNAPLTKQTMMAVITDGKMNLAFGLPCSLGPCVEVTGRALAAHASGEARRPNPDWDVGGWSWRRWTDPDLGKPSRDDRHWSWRTPAPTPPPRVPPICATGECCWCSTTAAALLSPLLGRRPAGKTLLAAFPGVLAALRTQPGAARVAWESSVGAAAVPAPVSLALAARARCRPRSWRRRRPAVRPSARPRRVRASVWTLPRRRKPCGALRRGSDGLPALAIRAGRFARRVRLTPQRILDGPLPSASHCSPGGPCAPAPQFRPWPPRWRRSHAC